MKEMNILYAIDEGKKDYTRYLGVSILSLLEHNKGENINIYILSQYIEESNKQELIRIVESFGKKIFFSEGEIIPKNFKKVISLRGDWPIATYYRFFFLNCFDISDRILYLDCDTIINKNLSKIYYSDFFGNVILGSSDIPVTAFPLKKKYGLDKYINAGAYIINIEKFKVVDLYKEIFEINKKYGIPEYNDQDYLNLIFRDKIKLCNLECLIYYKWNNYKYGDYYIFHTVEKPNCRGLCPKKMETLFDNYLSKTKWKSYVGYREAPSGTNYFFNKYIKISRFFEWLLGGILGDKGGYYTKEGFRVIKNFLVKIYHKFDIFFNL